MKRWFVLELTLPKRFVDGVSNFLMEQGAAGIEEIDVDSERQRLKTYFLHDGKEKAVLSALRRYLRSLKSLDPGISLARIQTASIPEQDWGENWKRFFKPVRVGPRFLVQPPWSKTPLKKGLIPIVITPGMAFGTGTHATTRLCVEALEQRVRRNHSVLDVGTGSGILSIAAAKLGAREVWGLDIDGLAVKAARDNLRQNSLSATVKIRKGGLGNVRGRFDIIVANIDRKHLKRLRISLLRRLNPRGILILSGILKGEEEEISRHYLETSPSRRAIITRKEEWVCIVLERK